MAISAATNKIITSIRTRVADLDETFTDEIYVEAISFALSKLSFDFGVSYSVVEDVPEKHKFLLIKLGTIEMCYIRASVEADGDAADDSGSVDISSVSVPDLSVSENVSTTTRGAGYWMELARALQDEYDGEVGDNKAGQNQGGEIEQGYMRRISLTTGGYRKRVLDPGLPAVTVSGVVTGSDVKLTWSKLLHEAFLAYEVFIDDTPTFDDEERLAFITDNHIVEFTDKARATGTWYYRVKTLNPNQLTTNSNTVTAVVP